MQKTRFISRKPNMEIVADSGDLDYSRGGTVIPKRKPKFATFGSYDTKAGGAVCETSDPDVIAAIKRSGRFADGTIAECNGKSLHMMPNNPIARMYVCEFCDEEFEKKTLLIEHRVREHESKPVGKAKMKAESKPEKTEKKQFKCGTCGEAFDSRVSVRWHRKKKHS